MLLHVESSLGAAITLLQPRLSAYGVLVLEKVAVTDVDLRSATLLRDVKRAPGKAFSAGVDEHRTNSLYTMHTMQTMHTMYTACKHLTISRRIARNAKPAVHLPSALLTCFLDCSAAWFALRPCEHVCGELACEGL